MRYGPVQVVLDVPEGDLLPAWANEPHEKQAASVVFFDAAGGRAIETLRLPAAYCVSYREQFVHGNAQSGSYQCSLTLSDPAGWTIAPGGPAAASGLGKVAIGAAISELGDGSADFQSVRELAMPLVN